MSETRTRILDAAQTLLTQRGLNGFTLEAVAAAAGVSKGGLLYHFASKEALVQAMVARYLELFEQRLQQALSAQPPGSGRRARAILETTLEDSGLHNGYKRALFNVAAANPEVMDPFRAYADQWLAELGEDGLPPGLAEAVCFAADGIWFSQMLGLLELPEAHRSRIEQCLDRLTRPDS